MVWSPPQGFGRAQVDPLTLTERLAAPPAAVNKGSLYLKDVAGRTELFYLDDTGAEMQITSGGAIVGGAVDTLAATLVAGNTAGGTAMRAAAGTLAAPGVAFEGDASVGMRLPSAGILDLVGTGILLLRLAKDGEADAAGTGPTMLAPHKLRVSEGGAASLPKLYASAVTGTRTGIFFPSGVGSVIDASSQTELGLSVDNTEVARFTNNFLRTPHGRRRARATKTAAFTAHRSEDVLFLDTSGGAFTATLPDAATHPGQVFHLRLIAGSATATLARSGADTIDGATTLLLAQVRDAVSVQADGTTWRVLHDSRRMSITHVLDNASAAAVTAMLGAVVVTGSFTSRYGGRLLILASGSLWSGTTGAKTLDLQIDGVVRASKRFFINEVNEHHAFAATFTLEAGIAAGARTIRWVTADAVTNTDANDRYDLTVVELPY